MVFAVNCELKMGVGKIAAQVAHAGLAIQRRLLQSDEKSRNLANEWEDMGYKVIRFFIVGELTLVTNYLYLF